MLRPQAFRFLHATYPRVHARFLVATSPALLVHNSRSHLIDPSAERASNTSSENSPSTPLPSSGLKSSEPSDAEDMQTIIRRWSERHFIGLRQCTDSVVARLATSFTRLGGEINRVTGYEEIESLKRRVISQGTPRLRPSAPACKDFID